MLLGYAGSMILLGQVSFKEPPFQVHVVWMPQIPPQHQETQKFPWTEAVVEAGAFLKKEICSFWSC